MGYTTLGQDIEVTSEITLGKGPITEAKVGIEIDLAVEMKDKGPEENQETGIEKVDPLQGLDLVPVLIKTGIDLDALGNEYDHFARECPNALTDEE